jgi:hypothetical protein
LTANRPTFFNAGVFVLAVLARFWPNIGQAPACAWAAIGAPSAIDSANEPKAIDAPRCRQPNRDRSSSGSWIMARLSF